MLPTHLMAESLRLCRPLAVTLNVMAPLMYLPSVARYMALRNANHRMELAHELNHMDCTGGHGTEAGGEGERLFEARDEAVVQKCL